MVAALNPGPRPRSLVLVAVVLALACGASTDGTSPSATHSPFPSVDPGPVGGRPAEAETPGAWAPSRAISFDRFALETALGSALREPAGAELGASTVWTLSGESVELRLEVRTWFSAAEAEMACRAAAGGGAEESLALGTPAWTAAEAVYVTQDAACIRVTVTRGARLDAAGARAVAAALVSGA